MPSAREMIERLDKFAEEIFLEKGEVPPVWFAEAGNGQCGLIPALTDDKDLQMVFIRKIFAAMEVKRYAYMAEAWTLSEKVDPATTTEFLRERPEQRSIADHADREEVVIYTGEDENGFILARRDILRPTGATASLAPLVWDDKVDHMEGRMVGLLPKTGKAN